METNLRALGASGAYTTDNDAFRAGMTVARNGTRWDPTGAASDPFGSHTITLDAGDYRITDLHGFMGAEGTTGKGRGLRFRGAGSDLTHVMFDPDEAGVLAFNQFWQNVKFEGITFATTKPGSTFMRTVAVRGSAVQDYTFTDVKWSGPWKYVFDLQGTNNNSEFKFYDCMTTLMADDGAFLYVGAEGTSDQFLNYWFYGFRHWSTDAALVDMARGGHVHLFGVDASNWGRNLTAPKYLLNLRGSSHSHGVQTLTTRGLRVEAKSVHAGLIHSEWASGNVDIQVDWSSQVNGYEYGDIISIDLGNVAGPVYNFHDSHLAGGVLVKYAVNAWEAQHRINFTNCGWKQRLTPTEAVTYADPPVNAIRPAVTFDGCRGDHQNPYSTEGATVWDATVSHDGGALVKKGGQRALTLRGIRGSVTSLLRVNLPVGAIITGLDPIASTGTWTVETSTGEHIASTGEPDTPFHCATRETATITIRETSGTKMQRGGFLTLTGYW